MPAHSTATFYLYYLCHLGDGLPASFRGPEVRAYRGLVHREGHHRGKPDLWDGSLEYKVYYVIK